MFRRSFLVAAASPWILCALSCARPGGPEITTDEFGDAGTGFATGVKCPAAVSSEPLAARAEVVGASSEQSNGDVVFTKDLFNQFSANCGECHIRNTTAQPTITLSNFATIITPDVVANIIKTDNLEVVMPPYHVPYSARVASGPGDPVVKLVELLELWIAWGRPSGSFPRTPPGSPDATGPTTQSGYSLAPELGARLTNIGSCIPNKYAIGVNRQSMDQLDSFFAQATALPDVLDKTDLVTFDSDALARNGVISYAPAYPLWSDAAGKMRHVRVPRGQSIAFDKKTQQFSIPPNTRFYKTFFKEVVDAGGNRAWKRIETRLIVARPDQTQPDGTIKQTALFGTYIWNEDETKTELLNDPLHNAQPFTDRVLGYITDEPMAASVVGTNVSFDKEALGADYPGLVRHYALPSSQRCVQCHMGSPSAAFVLGFTPLQVATMPPGTSGVIEPATADEITQLQRLIDYKVISGMTSPADVVPLESTQLPRTPRNDYELKAQAYMVGNCSHCHNPRGFPSTKAPELKEVLNFLPGPDGGVFQFPLDRTSPVRARGLNQDVPIPYITPSLRDYPAQSPNPSTPTYLVKYLACPDDTGKSTNGWCTTPGKSIDFIDAPWRSLIYRNVDTPFDYVDDLAIFPHMPMNTPGYDCRAAQIMGDWMVSIPATYVGTTGGKEDAVGDPSLATGTPDTSAQPYVEVRPGDSGYTAAQTAAQKRLAQYHAGHRYGFCPDTTDTIDRGVNPTVSTKSTPADKTIVDQTVSPSRLIMPPDSVPDRPHWVVTDTTDPPGDWYPRGFDWKKPLVHQELAHLGDSQVVIDDLKNIKLDDSTRQALMTEVPFGLWTQKPGCDFSGVPTAGNYQGADRPVWMDLIGPDAAPNAPVYLQSAGAAVFTNICVNCHGPEADAKGLLADEVSLLTGGDARVANFRIGLFGPEGRPGANRDRVFGSLVPSATSDEAGARYLAWMALGGTTKLIPQSLLNVVATTPILGEKRSNVGTAASANMLQLAQELCRHTLLAEGFQEGPLLGGDDPIGESFFTRGPLGWTSHALTKKNGDAELWFRVCSLNNRPVVRVASAYGWSEATSPHDLHISVGESLFWGAGPNGEEVYPRTAPVLDQRGDLAYGLTPDNLFPVCLRQPAGDPGQPGTQAYFAERFRTSHLVNNKNAIPYCPQALFVPGNGDPDPNTGVAPLKWQLPSESMGGEIVSAAAEAWAARGAINAGLAVFLYVDQLSKGATPKPAYNHCELLRH